MSKALVVFSVVRSHVIMFISEEEVHMEKYVQPAVEAAKHFRGQVLFVAIDVDVDDHERILDFFNIDKDTLPTFRFVHFVNHANKKFRPKSDDMSPESIISFVQAGIDGKLKVEVKSEKLPEDWDKTPVKTLVGSNFDDDAEKDVRRVPLAMVGHHQDMLHPILLLPCNETDSIYYRKQF